MSHDELIAALAVFIPNIGTIGDKIDDAGLSALLELMKGERLRPVTLEAKPESLTPTPKTRPKNQRLFRHHGPERRESIRGSS